jgi:hypothetical protein
VLLIIYQNTIEYEKARNKILVMVIFQMKSFHTRDFIGLYYPSPMKSGGDIVFGVVRPSVIPNFVSALVLCNYWLEFNETFIWEPSMPSEDVHTVALFRSDPSTQSYGP